ncbi:MAG: hypothetical protein F4Z16_04575 [Rhodothermaceae bacterium]|nr:hypothetical protein [Rhodothermaceae bacterium]MYB91748.1 hypothetical protein [Rhodothermaceae bacterium]MYD67538.1 hypothetical protein [Rhodothermaceae bacterium]MYG45555.1 hypothetical protein [Rhodothermaceae bacterium]MYH13440.1 hypothetical protein [Rhodothermaceae bacterium]
MISQAKWERKEWMDEGEISADAVTADLRTQNNSLSFWKCAKKTHKEIENVALAIAAGRDKIDKVEIVLIDNEDLKTDGQNIETSNGRTPVESLVKRHVDLMQLDYTRLGKVARRVASAVAANQCHRVSKQRVQTLLVTAITRDETLQIDRLNENLRPQVQKLLNRY